MIEMSEVFGVRAYCGLVENDNLWFCDKGFDTLFMADSRGQLNYVCDLTKKAGPGLAIIKIVFWKESIIAFPRYSYGYWMIHSVSDDKWDADYYEYGHDADCTISAIEQNGNEVWVFPNTSDIPIYCIDLDTQKTERINWMCPEKSSYITKTVYRNKHIYFATRLENRIYIGDFDCDKRKATYTKVDNARYVNCICVHQESVYALYINRLGETVLEKFTLDGISQKEYILREVNDIKNSLTITYLMMEIVDKHLILYQYDSYRIIDVNLDDNTRTDIYYDSNAKGGFWESYKLDNKTFLISACGDAGIFSHTSKKFETITFSATLGTKGKLCKKLLMEEDCIVESICLGLDAYINAILQKNIDFKEV